MKTVTALIRPEQLPAVKKALFDVQMRHLTATTVMGTAPKSEQQMYRGVRREVELFPRIRVEVSVSDAQLETVIEAMSRGAKETGGWGRIFVHDLEEIVTIWSGERGPRAL